MNGLAVARPWRAALLAALLVLQACALGELQREAGDYEASTVLVGRVERGAVAEGSIVVGAYARGADGRWQRVHQTRLHESGGYELIVPPGRYALFAYADRNGNGLFDAGEPVARHAAGDVVAQAGQALVGGLDLVLGEGGVEVPRVAAALAISTQAGALADWSSPMFQADSGKLGYWQPMSYFHRYGGNVHLIEPYDPARTPVLFVHGAVGSPQDWKTLAGRLDRSRFQAWFYAYPSGAAVDSVSHLLFWKLFNLQLRHHYPRLLIVAHSMGGLVVRRMLLDNGHHLPQVTRFVSLSTPWAGEPGADLGVKMSPAVVPSWRDMQPEGAFMRSLFDRRLPPHIEYDLLFGHRGAPGLFRPNNDGTVTLASQLRRAAQEEARLVFGFDEDHVGILESAQVATQLQALLAASAGAGGDASLQLRLLTDGAPAQGVPLLVLRPLDGGPPLTASLRAAEGGARVGALPPGRYEAGLIADGWAAEPRRQPLVLERGAEARLEVRLRPQGALSAYVADERGRVAGAYAAPAAQLRVRRVVLRGPGLLRELQPDTAPDAMSRALLKALDGQDAAWDGSFAFTGLPAGDYELEIEADGREPHRQRVQVQPGRSGTLPPIVMAPRR
ncbi:MAG: hypothetical protein U1F56_12070 [Rubrivivax sp.]